MSDESTLPLFVTEARAQLRESLVRIQHCVAQLDDEQMWWRPRPDQNSIANLVLHLGGNLQQRILSVLGGERDHRDRDREFTERGPMPKGELIPRFEQIVAAVDQRLAGLTASELSARYQYDGATRHFDETGLGVVMRTLVHLSGHAQEIVGLTRRQLGANYQFQGAPPPK